MTNPLVQDGQKLIPSVTRVFSRAATCTCICRRTSAAANVQPLVAFVTFYRGQTKAFETPPLPVTEGMDTDSKPCRCGSAWRWRNCRRAGTTAR